VSRYATYTQVISADVEIELATSGNYVRCLDATGIFLIGLDDDPLAEFTKGLGFELPDARSFSRLRIYNPGSTAITVQLATAYGRVLDSRASFADAIPVGAAPHLVTGPDISVPAEGVALLAAGDTKRREIIVQNRSQNAREIRIGDAAASAVEGVELQPGETWRMAVTGDVFAYNLHTADAVVAVAVITG
jgi:hypothetical protein